MQCVRRKMLRRRSLKKTPKADIGADDARARKCIATGVIASPEGFIRFVVSPEGSVAPDFTGKLPGRGAWVSSTREAVETARRKGAFARAFKQGVTVPDNLVDQVEAGLAKGALSALGLARKVGDAVLGFEKVRAKLKAGEVAALITAAEAGEDGKAKLRRLAKGAVTIDDFTESELSAALGRDGVVHVALKSGPAAARFLRETRRLEGFRLAALQNRAAYSGEN